MMPHTTRKKRDAYNAVANDHDSGEKSVACQGGCFHSSSNHHGDDECYFNSCYCESKHQCAEGLADTKRHDFGMIDGRKNRCDQSKRFPCSEHSSGPVYEMQNKKD